MGGRMSTRENATINEESNAIIHGLVTTLRHEGRFLIELFCDSLVKVCSNKAARVILLIEITNLNLLLIS